MKKNYREIRADYNDHTIRVYQAFSDEIANSALENGKFITPPFKLNRMTWIKPSFLWMMYRSSWGFRDQNQKRILAIDILKSGFEWALQNSCLSHYEETFFLSKEDWQYIKNNSPVRIQWDPERNIILQPLNYRTIQIGLSAKAVNLYINNWIVKISDVTNLAHQIHKFVLHNELDKASCYLPQEKKYIINKKTASRIGIFL